MKESLCFWTTGEAMTTIIRDLWDSCLISNALDICESGGATKKISIGLCTGKFKLEGDSREGDLEIVKDNTKTYFTLKKQVIKLENDFIFLADMNAQMYREIKWVKVKDRESYMDGDIENDKKAIEKNKEKISAGIISKAHIPDSARKKNKIQVPNKKYFHQDGTIKMKEISIMWWEATIIKIKEYEKEIQRLKKYEGIAHNQLPEVQKKEGIELIELTLIVLKNYFNGLNPSPQEYEEIDSIMEKLNRIVDSYRYPKNKK